MIRFHHLWPLVMLILPLGYLYWKREELRLRPLADRLAIALRVGALLLVLVALAGPQLLSRAEAHYVYFLVDRSASARSALTERELIERLNTWAVPQSNTEYGLIVFGAQPFLEVPFSPSLKLEEIHTEVDVEGTDLAAAIELALATFPQRGTKTLLLFSDGRATRGDLPEVLLRARREGVRIFTLPLGGPELEFSILDLRAPQEVAVGLPFTFQSVIYASRPAQGQLLISRDGRPLLTREIFLRAGLNFVEESDKLPEPGVYEYRAQLIVPQDTLVPNNTYRALVEAVGEPRILLVEAGEQESLLERLLERAGYTYRRISPEELAPTVSSLLPYRAVILDDVPLRGLTQRQISYLEHYVRDLGGGLWVIQGRRAVEEFYDREFERLLPVTYEGPEEIQRPAMALVMLLDRSGSMGEVAGLQSKIDLLKEAALEAVDQLDPNNLIGIIAFDAQYEWLVPLGPVRGRKGEIQRAIAALFPNGGTDIYQALRDATTQLQGVDARVKHLLVFSDGKVSREGRNFTRLFREIAETTISASSIAIGPQADFDLLWQLAEVGAGAKYAVKDAEDLPEITLEEVVRLERARWIKGPAPVVAGPYAFELQGIEAAEIPPVDGYVLTFEKATAQTALKVGATADEDLPADPLVSRWRYGLGKVLVLNTSLSGEGLGRWLDWEGLEELSAQLLAQVYSEIPLQPKGLTLTTELEDQKLTVTVEAERDGRWLDLLKLDGRLSAPGREPVPLRFEQVGPGRYKAALKLGEGVYLLSVREESLGLIERALSIPYAKEYRHIGVDQERLTQIAYETGGQYLESDQGISSLLRGRTLVYREIWQPMVLIALGLFLADLIARKLPLAPS